jgi:HEAT repeat protein/thioredoxin-like negative regulator of GroEL
MPCFNKLNRGERSRCHTVSLTRRCRLLLAAICVLFSFAAAQCVFAVIVVSAPVFHTSVKAASEAAAGDQSLVVIVFGADWCAPCKALKSKTLASKEFLEQGGALHLVEVDIDAEPGLARDYSVQAVPTLVVQTADSRIVTRKEGFMQTVELLLWLKDARDRVKDGKWEGTAPGSKLTKFITRAAEDQLSTNDIAQLIGMLGESDPADRQAISKLLLDQREQVVLPLIETVTNSYLGARIAATELLARLAPGVAVADPWQSPAELAETVASLNKWWSQTGKLPAPVAATKLDPADAASIRTALDHLRHGDAVQRTEAMSLLVSRGGAALPELRETMKACEKTGDQRALTLLDDVRWAILIPETLEQQAPSVRNVLARGKSAERQDAATRLGRAGRPAIPALTELLNDADPLVAESAVRALSNVGGVDAIPAMAALLKSSDSNLRMTAAQGLGHTKNPVAVKDLLTVLDDPNEVVSCTALSALVEIFGERDYSNSKKAKPPEIIAGLKTSLADPRWRVRAAAAEAAGKLDAKELGAELTSLLDDADGFVVKSALESLRSLGSTPDPEKLMGVAGRHSGVRGQAVEMLVNWGTDDAVKSVTQTYQSSTVEGRLEILGHLQGNSGREQNTSTSVWQPLLAQGAAEPDPRLRRAAVEAIGLEAHSVAASLIGPLLSDEDSGTRSKAAIVVLSIIGGERMITSHGGHGGMELWGPDLQDFSAGNRPSKTNEPPATPARLAAWHSALLQKAGPTPDPMTAAAIFVTGPRAATNATTAATNSAVQSSADLLLLQTALEHADKEAMVRFSKSPALAAIIPRLPWPAGKPLIERLCASASSFLHTLSYAQNAPAALADFLYEPARFRAAVEPASMEELASLLPRALSAGGQNQWSLLSGAPRIEPILAALIESTNSAWRAASVYALGAKGDEKSLPIFERAVKDANPWVRAAAVPGLARTAKDRAALETRLAPLLADQDKKVVERASIGLLEAETRAAAGIDYMFDHFEFEKIHAWSGSYEPKTDQRPLAALETKPAFLDLVRQRLAQSSDEDVWLPALLLAQYGDFTGLDRMLQSEIAGTKKSNGLGNVLPAMVSLSRDAKYVPQLKKLVAAAKDDSDYRELLQAIKGMPGPEARELRVEINKRIRLLSNE